MPVTGRRDSYDICALYPDRTCGNSFDKTLGTGCSFQSLAVQRQSLVPTIYIPSLLELTEPELGSTGVDESLRMAAPHEPVFSSLFVGNIFSSILFGGITVQTKLYFARFPNDSRAVKVMVALLWVLQLLQVVIATQDLYRQIIEHNWSRSPDASNRTNLRPQWQTQYWATHLLAAAIIVECFYAYRLWILSRRRAYTAVISSMILFNAGELTHRTNTARTQFQQAESPPNLSTALGFDVCRTNFLIGSRVPTSPRPFAELITLVSSTVVVDLAIAFGVTITMRKHHTGFLQTDRVVNWVTLYGVASGVMTSIFAITMLIFYIIGDDRHTVGVGGIFGASYIVSALAHLHSRTRLRSRLAAELPRHLDKGVTPSSEIISTHHVSQPQEKRTILPSNNHPSTSYPVSMTDPGIEMNDFQSSMDIVRVTRTIETTIDADARSPSGSGSHRNHQLRISTLHRNPEGPADPSVPSRPLPSLQVSTKVCNPLPPRFSPTELFAKGRQRSETNSFLPPSPDAEEVPFQLSKLRLNSQEVHQVP
ncbi:hypothetical protein DL93DRAFT_2230206 [Clavulina sp. PMI_390]|nr:hypothetical protein DL93DRAFT_2230206 [Clavulina sp. PMI_390]